MKVAMEVSRSNQGQGLQVARPPGKGYSSLSSSFSIVPTARCVLWSQKSLRFIRRLR